MWDADLTAVGLLAGSLLWLLEAFVFFIGVGYLWEFVDVLARRTWSSYVDLGGATPRGRQPFVSLHVPTHNEPPDMVIATLESLLALEYDHYEILLVDNNTTDPALWQPVETFCAAHDRVTFIHLEDWPGYKSGALNHALTVTDPRTEVIGIVDADYVVRPDFLERCAPLFDDPDVAFVQTPQDYRDWEMAPYFRRLYFSYGYFFDVSQKSRNERNGAIFGGTMGLIRRSALVDVGGWDEWCITEDAELSLRLLRAGGRGLHVDQSFGHGVMPLTFEALKRQRFRWCFGGVQILRLHWRSLLPGRRTPENRLTWAQRWAYLVGSLQWFGDLASVLFTGFLLLGAVEAALGEGVVLRRLSGFLLVCVVALVMLGAVRSLALVRRTSGATWGEALGAFGLWMALGWTVAQAALRGLFARAGVFLRTPKVRGELGLRDALRGNRLETALALVCAGVAVWSLSRATLGSVAVGVLLLMHAIGYATAPINSVAAIRSELPEELRRRRRETLQSWGRPTARRGGFVLVSAATVLAGLVVFAGPVGAPDLTDLPDVLQPGESTDESPTDDPADPLGTIPGGLASGTALVAASPSATATGVGATVGATVGSTPTGTGAATLTPGATTRPPQATVPTQATAPTPATAPAPATPTSHPSGTAPTQAPTTPAGGRLTTTPTAQQ
jgi:cellulose synthase/poly-beta-1,6-N-acetylglucosamine synthase-like glycosyltransferase